MTNTHPVNKRGRPEHPRIPEALAFMKLYPNISQKAIAKKFSIPPSTFFHAIGRHAKRCEHCGGKIHA